MLSRRQFLVRAAGGAAALAGAASVAQALDGVPTAPVALTVYKSPTCGCCKQWVTHLNRTTPLAVTARDVADMDEIHAQLGIPAALRSCHTAVAAGYVFEGHVPGDLVMRVLKERPKIAGLAVPGMVSGSPGMENGVKDPYDVVAFTRAGKTSVYAKR